MPVGIFELLGLWPEPGQSPEDKPHLRHTSLAAWFKAEGLTGPLMSTIKDEAERERRLHEYGELKRFLFAKHLGSLPEAEQQEYRAGTHPSQSHRFRDRAALTAQQLQEELAQRGYVAKVEIGFYHLERIVLSAELSRWPNEEEWPSWPWFFRGFEVRYGLVPSSESR
jgi:hypothetical protein